MRSVIIIGSGPGISRSVARRFGAEGFAIGLIARREGALMEETGLLAYEGIDSCYAVADAGNEEAVCRGIDTIRHRYGEPEMILYNVSSSDVRDILEQKWDTILSALNINAGGAFHVMKHVLPDFIRLNKGKIFLTGNGLSLRGNDEWVSLGVGKSVLRHLAQCFMARVRHTNVHIAHLIIRGTIDPLDKKYNPDSIAELYWSLFCQPAGNYENEILY